MYGRGAAENSYKGIPFSQGPTNRPEDAVNRSKALESKDTKGKEDKLQQREGDKENILNVVARGTSLWSAQQKISASH